MRIPGAATLPVKVCDILIALEHNQRIEMQIC